MSTKQEQEARRRVNPPLEQQHHEHRPGSREARAAISAELYRVLLERDAQLLGLVGRLAYHELSASISP